MAVISSIIAGITAAATAIASAASAVGGFLAMPLGVAFGAGAGAASVAGAGGILGGITVGGALAAVGTVAAGATALGAMYKSSRASAAAQQAQMKAIQQLSDSETGQLEVNETASGIQENSRIKRTLSSLRISMLPQAQDNQQITQNVYGVDTNQVATSTQNMTGLNIVAA